MVRAEYRIVVAVVAVFASLAGLSVAIDGLLFDKSGLVRYGFAAMVVGVAAFVLLLNPASTGDE
ncbi:DUF2964 family protein [Paraburkholderia phenoliruptrix]|jgi:hypothetical protein|uniref:DUF2964 domain-containing protein n=2 Tax=Paraburkholderia phenoliruptrix TaxID=252970 RepID=A0A6J5KF26_9BURK|nr:DUF2964 family protein [Paraburkholderia phenoliruptrix]AFT88995.1 hypothetical protein BUPH_06430 [Paraburkholderia phenoliruptrix BR3459a]MDR6423391.1 hypothetical protein [Paraburkholderia phenoliruptrix]WMY11118.1 DUF2964 family protein [Paraburkholderia phenoliruptrix]CAB3737974.1 hypothetical protein LMG22037_06199 [Paraburkholderia phenoliruptrix]CAB4052428.1 hypothetical protein LMG9964_06118 [Paraburkholderia phenoliruptrix]